MDGSNNYTHYGTKWNFFRSAYTLKLVLKAYTSKPGSCKYTSQFHSLAPRMKCQASVRYRSTTIYLQPLYNPVCMGHIEESRCLLQFSPSMYLQCNHTRPIHCIGGIVWHSPGRSLTTVQNRLLLLPYS